MGILTIKELLHIRGLESGAKVKLVRHKDNRSEKEVNGELISGNLIDWYRLKDKTKFLDYQSEQSKDVFKGADYIVAFIGEENSTARLIGVFKNLGYDEDRKQRLNSDKFYYKLEIDRRFEELSERVIIDWGKSAISWHQWLDSGEKEVIAIVPGFDHMFPGYNKVTLSFSQMRDVFINKQYPEWKKMLSSVNCVYVIDDSKSESLYIGSTYNRDGIWGRWSQYAATGHGGNVELKKLIDKDPKYAEKHFKWSILEILPIDVTQDEAVKRHEQRFKEMLPSVCKLNLN